MDFSLLPSWAGPLGGTIAGIIAITFAAIHAYALGFSKTEKIKDNASQELVKILQSTVNELRVEVTNLSKAHLENQREISKLSGENETLMEILQGRDDDYLRFRQEGFAAFKRIEENHETMVKLFSLLERNLAKK